MTTNNQRENVRRYARRERQKLIARYGGHCDCCGEDRFEFLTIDHIGGGGRKERKKFKTNFQYYRQMLYGPKRDDLRVLCYNCNCALGMYGYCPHVEK